MHATTYERAPFPFLHRTLAEPVAFAVSIWHRCVSIRLLLFLLTIVILPVSQVLRPRLRPLDSVCEAPLPNFLAREQLLKLVIHVIELRLLELALVFVAKVIVRGSKCGAHHCLMRLRIPFILIQRSAGNRKSRHTRHTGDGLQLLLNLALLQILQPFQLLFQSLLLSIHTLSLGFALLCTARLWLADNAVWAAGLKE